MDRFAKETSVSSQQQVARLFAWPLELMLRSQANLASATQEAYAAFDRLVHCRDIGEAFAIQQQWLTNNIRRFGGAFDAAVADTSAVSVDAAKAASGDAAPAMPGDAATAASRDAAAVARESASHAAEAARAATGRAAAHAMHPEQRRGEATPPSPRPRRKSAGKRHKSRKHRSD